MSEYVTKIQKVMDLAKIEVEDKAKFAKDFEAILKMFESVSDVDVSEYSSNLKRKSISISDLREDKPEVFANFNFKYKGKYFKVPSVSKKAK